MNNEQIIAQLKRQLADNTPRFKKKFEESKLIVRWAICLFTAIVLVTLIFGTFRISLSPDTFFVVKFALTGLLTLIHNYFVTKTLEKKSRNRHGLDENGENNEGVKGKV